MLSRSVTYLPQKKFGFRDQGGLPSSGIRVKLQGGSGGSPNAENPRRSELNWIFKNYVKGDLDNGHIGGNPGTQSQKIYMIYLQSGGNFGNFSGKGLGELCQNFRENNIEWDLHKTNLRSLFC